MNIGGYKNTSAEFWKCVGKDPADTKVIFVPSAAVKNDGAREGIAVCVERLMYRSFLKL